ESPWLFEPRHTASVIERDEAPADGDSRRGDDLAVPDQREFGRAAANVNVQNRRTVAPRDRYRARPMRRERCLHVVPGERTHEFSGLGGEQVSDRLGVLPLE